MNEVQTNEAQVPTLSPEAQKGLETFAAELKTYVEPIKVTYQTSDAFKKRLAELGEFFYNGESLGKEIICVPIRYCFQANATKNNGNDFQSTIKFTEEFHNFAKLPRFTTWRKKYEADGCKIDMGVSLFLYLPELNMFASFFCKNKLLQGAVKTTPAISQKKAVKLVSIWNEKNGREWAELSPTFIDMPDISEAYPKINEMYQLFMKERGDFEKSEDKTAAKTARER